MNGQEPMLQTRPAGGNRADKDRIVMIEAQENGAAVAGKERGETNAREWVAAARDARNDRQPAALEADADVSRFVQADNPNAHPPRRQGESERLDHAFRPPGRER